MNELQSIKHMQRAWAASREMKFSAEGYLSDVEANLRKPLSPSAKTDFSRGAGSELASHMRALHSSSALVANFFDFWTNRDKGPLMGALGIGEAITESLRFERRFPTGLRGTPPHLDVVLGLEGGVLIAIESKFTEQMSLSTRGRSLFASAYFPSSRRLWANAGLPNCQYLAEEMNVGDRTFHLLDACQLLKHSLGLATVVGTQFSLNYVYYDSSAEKSGRHQEDLNSFARGVGDEIGFRSLTYQQAYARLLGAREDGVEYMDYLEYLGTRYFPEMG